MKKLLMLFMLCTPILLNAQLIRNIKTDEKIELKESVEKYCCVILQPVSGKIEFHVAINEMGTWEFIDANGSAITLKTNVAVFNFMYKNGWEFINNIGGTEGAPPQYLFKKMD